MSGYRLYFLDEEDHIIRANELECSSDEEAIVTAEQCRDGRDVELWQKARFIKKIPKLPKG